MPAASLLALLDDIASVLDDVSILTKKAAAKTAGVLGDDLALNAQQVSGVVAKRELPVVFAVARGSFVNKLILVPLALVIGTFAPWAIMPLLMIGGLYLCFEGCEKLHHHLKHRGRHSSSEATDELNRLATTESDNFKETEADKIKGAIRTDFVLSAEIIAITLGTVADADFTRRLLVLSAIAMVMTVGVYGLVAGIVKLDDAGLHLSRSKRGFNRQLGAAILRAAPWLMKSLSVLGTAAMFLVGGGIVTHGIPWLHHSIESWARSAGATSSFGTVLEAVLPPVANGLCGLAAGTLVLLAVSWIGRLRAKA